MQAPSPDVRQSSVSQHPSTMDDDNDSNRDYGMSSHYKTGADGKYFNPAQQQQQQQPPPPPSQQQQQQTQPPSYSIDSVMGSNFNATNDISSYPNEMKSSLKKYRHKQQPIGKPQDTYGSTSSEFKMNDQYGSYPMEGESTLSYLEKTASSIDERKSAFKATLSNITKPTPDMLGYGSQSLYSGGSAQPPVKPKAKPRSRSRKTPAKTETILKPDPIPSPVQSLPMKQPDKTASISNTHHKDNVIDSRLKSQTPGGWRIDETQNKPQLSSDHYHGSAVPSMSSYPAEKNLTIPHTDVNTTYNHSNQTYQQYSSSHSTAGHSLVQQSPFALTQSKPESSMYSSHGTVHHPYSRTESTAISQASTIVTTNSMQPTTNTASMANHPYSAHSSVSGLSHSPHQSTVSVNSITHPTLSLSSSAPFINTSFDPLKPTQSPHLLATHQEQNASASLPPHASQIDSLSLHSQHYSPYGM